MGINLDELISGSNSVEDLVAGLSEESAANAKATAQVIQIADASKGTMSPLNWLRDKLTASSGTPKAPAAAGAAKSLDLNNLYTKYVVDTAGNGEEPLSKEDFQKRVEEQQQLKAKSGSGSKATI